MEIKCTNLDCGEYPYYGVAPHICYHRQEGGFNNPLGTSKKAHPDNKLFESFELDIEGIDPEADTYAGGCGIYYCPECKKGMPENMVKNKFGAYYKPFIMPEVE